MKQLNKFTLGLIINPIAGMGGSVGLKGTDGIEILKKAIDLGANPNALNRTRELLKELESIKSKLKFVTCPRFMGETVLKQMNFEYELIEHPIYEKSEDIYSTTSEHTKIAAEIMKKVGELKLILFVGGDGTARDILSAVNKEKPCLGIPAGVKIYSSTFSLNPKLASSLIIQFLWDEVPLREAEVLDIDEGEYRNGRLVSKIIGYLNIPYNPDFIQYSKIGSPYSDLNNQERIAKRIVEILKNEVYYLLGPGTTVKAITDILKQEKTVLGIDLLLNKKIIGKDLTENQILSFIEGKKIKIIISLIGKQGFLFGRGNLQFSPIILEKIGPENIIIIATNYKLQNINHQILRLDTRSSELDEKMRGLYKILVDYDEIRICKVE